MGDVRQVRDLTLLESWRAGDKDAGEELLRRHFVDVYRFFETQLGAARLSIDPEDLAQRTFEACIQMRDRVETNFRGYLFGIARHELMQEWQRRRNRGAVIPESQAEILDHRTSPSGAVARADVEAQFATAVEKLPLEFKAVVERFYWRDKTIPEIAEELGVATGTVKSRLYRAKALLRKHLQESGAPAAVRESAVLYLDRDGPDAES